jgi:hypothetical protein
MRHKSGGSIFNLSGFPVYILCGGCIIVLLKQELGQLIITAQIANMAKKVKAKIALTCKSI